MRLVIALAVLFVAAAAPAVSKDVRARKDPEAEELKKLQGTWVLESAEIGGKKKPLRISIKMVIKGRKVTYYRSDNDVPEERDIYNIGKDAKSRYIESRWVHRGNIWHDAILYRLDGKQLKFCISPDIPPSRDPRTAMRPRAFSSEGRVEILVYRREK